MTARATLALCILHSVVGDWTPCGDDSACKTSGQKCCLVGPPPAPGGGSCCVPADCIMNVTIAGPFQYCRPDPVETIQEPPLGAQCLQRGYSCARCMGRPCCCDGLFCDESGPPKCEPKHTPFSAGAVDAPLPSATALPPLGATYAGVSDGGHVGWACNASVSFTSQASLDISVGESTSSGNASGICDVGPVHCTGLAWSADGRRINVMDANKAGNCIHDSLAGRGRGILKAVTYDRKKEAVTVEVLLNFTVKHIDVVMDLKKIPAKTLR